MRSRLNTRQIESPSAKYAPPGRAVPIATSGRCWTSVHACSAKASATAVTLLLSSERILDDLPFRFDQGFDPTPAAVVKQGARVVGRDEVMALRSHLSARCVDRRRPQR